MTFAADDFPALLADFGSPVLYRTGPTGAPVTDGVVSAGALTMDLKVLTGHLTGTILAGATFTVAGEVTPGPAVVWTTVGDTPDWQTDGGLVRTAAALTINGISLDLLSDTVGNCYTQRVVTLTGNGVKRLSMFLARSGAAPWVRFQLRSTVSGSHLDVQVNFTATVPVVTVITGTLVSAVALGAGYVITADTTSMVAAETNSLLLSPSWGQATAAAVDVGHVLIWDVAPTPVSETYTVSDSPRTPAADAVADLAFTPATTGWIDTNSALTFAAGVTTVGILEQDATLLTDEFAGEAVYHMPYLTAAAASLPGLAREHQLLVDGSAYTVRGIHTPHDGAEAHILLASIP